MGGDYVWVCDKAHARPLTVFGCRRGSQVIHAASWKLFEERFAGLVLPANKDAVAAAAAVQYLWDRRYTCLPARQVDAPVLRWRDADGLSGNGLEETLYFCNDANMNVTAVVGQVQQGDPPAATWKVLERYVYDAYGNLSVRDEAWAALPASAVANEVLYCGYRYDAETGLYHVRQRYYACSLGIWTTRDPAGYVDGPNSYQQAKANPLAFADPAGTETISPNEPPSQILAKLRDGISQFKAAKPDWKLAPAAIEHWLVLTGTDLWISAQYLLEHHVGLAAKHIRETQFPKSLSLSKDLTHPKGQWLSDSLWIEHWDRAFISNTRSNEMSYLSGTSTLQGQGIFSVDCQIGAATGFIRYIWYDLYNWDHGKTVRLGKYSIRDRAMLKLKENGLGADYSMFGMWMEKVRYVRVGQQWRMHSSELLTWVPPATTTQAASQPSSTNADGGSLPAAISLTPPTLPEVTLNGKRIVWGGNFIVTQHHRNMPWAKPTRYWGVEQ